MRGVVNVATNTTSVVQSQRGSGRISPEVDLHCASMARNKPDPNAWTPSQIVAYGVALARKLRGWTQEQAAAELQPILGARLSPASFSAIERSFAGGRSRQFDADELVALARG